MGSFASPRSVGGLLVFALVLLAAGCSGSSTDPPPGQGSGALSGSLALFGQDAPLDNLVKFEITVTGITLNPGNVQVSLPAGGVRLELTSLQITTDLIRLDQNIPAGTYTSVDLTLANPEIKFRISSGTCPDGSAGPICEVEPPLQTSSVTINVSFSIVQGQLTALLFDFDLRAMVITDAGGNITGVNPSGNIAVSLVNVAGDVGEFEDEIGRVVSVNATDSTFVFEPFSSCQQVTITTDTATVFEDFAPLANAFASLQVDQIVEVDADLRVDGTFLAEKVEFEDDTMEDEIEGLIVSLTRNTGPSQDSFDLVLFDVAPCTATLPADDIFTVNVSTTPGVVDFRIDEDDLSVDPALFDGPEDLEVGQKVDVDPVEALGTDPITAEKIKLEDQTIRGTVNGSPAAPNFELSPGSSLFTDPDNSITVRTSSVTEFDDSLPLDVASLLVNQAVRVRGLLFRDLAGELIFEAKRVDGTP
ncbi:MAG: DUF4382 domain-containing protein [Acidobacteria bacterium]|nr:DUF4382 domain-containing protein [Acidobacteriota bacterium]